MDDRFSDDPPAKVRWGLPRLLRIGTGVNEETLSTVRAERPRYTAMGGVVYGTALLAMLSMSYALYCVFGGFRYVIISVVLIWGLFILSLDRWLMSSPPSSTGGLGGRMLARVVLSVALGVVVAEPLLLGVFGTAIEERVARDRQVEIVERESILKTCNPVPGTTPAPGADPASAECDSNRLDVKADRPDVVESELSATKTQQEDLRAKVTKDAAEYAALEEKARRECNGTPGPGLTGRFGVGPNCRRLRGEADTLYRDRRIAENNQRLSVLDQKVIDLTTEVEEKRQAYARAINDAIEAELRAIRDRHGAVGLLERFRALSDLVHENGYVLAAQWGLRLMLIVVDALPVLLKVLSGETTYDRVAARRLGERERRQQLRGQAELGKYEARVRVYNHQTQQDMAKQVDLIDFAIRRQYANLDEHREALISARERVLLRTGLGPPGARDLDPEATQDLIIEQPLGDDEDGLAAGRRS